MEVDNIMELVKTCLPSIASIVATIVASIKIHKKAVDEVDTSIIKQEESNSKTRNELTTLKDENNNLRKELRATNLLLESVLMKLEELKKNDERVINREKRTNKENSDQTVNFKNNQ